MNAVFHAGMGIAVGAALAKALPAQDSPAWVKREDMPLLLAGLSLIFLHGVLDILPSTYPFPWWNDIPLTLLLLALTLAAIRRRYRLLLSLSFWRSHLFPSSQPSIGRYRLLLSLSFWRALLPDLVETPLLNHIFYWHLPTWEVFPWHWERRPGSIYDGRWIWLSALDHALVLSACAGLLFASRKRRVHIWRI